MNLTAALRGARLQRVDAPFEGLLALSVYGRDARGVLLIGLSPRARWVGFTRERPKGRPASGPILGLRKHLEGARIESFEQPSPGLLVLALRRAESQRNLLVQLFGRGNLLLLDADDRVLLALHRPAQNEPLRSAPKAAKAASLDADEDALALAADRLCAAYAGGAVDERRERLRQALRRQERRLERRLAAIARDRERASEVEALRARATLVLSHLHALAPDAARATLLDTSTTPPQPVELSFDPALGPRRQAEAWFARARKLERGARVAAERAALTESERARLSSVCEAVEAARDEAALAEAEHDARALGVAPQPPPRERRDAANPPRLPYREFVGSQRRTILVGRGPADNDRLTLDKARPQDLWLHVREHGGAHVVVPLGRDEACPPDLLCDAATIAAHFSQARDQRDVDVIYTQRRYVRKQRKAPAGRVVVEREKVFRLRLEPARLARLLASEIRRV